MLPLITKELLDFYDEYEGDFGLLDERWAPEKDRDRLEAFGREQAALLGEYLDKLHSVIVERLSDQLRTATAQRLSEIETCMAPEVIVILRHRTSSFESEA